MKTILYACALILVGGCLAERIAGRPSRSAPLVLPPRAERAQGPVPFLRSGSFVVDQGTNVMHVGFDLANRRLSYRMPLDPLHPSLPLPDAPQWRSSSPRFRIEGLNGLKEQGEWLFDLSRVVESEKVPMRVLLSQPLYAWGVAHDGTSEVVVMDWRDQAGQPSATVLVKDVPNSDWVAFLLYSSATAGAEETLLFENLPFAYWASPTSVRENGVAHADGNTIYEKKGESWDIDNRRYWALTYNVGSQQTAGAGYVFHPDDFSRLTVNRGRGGVKAEIRPGHNQVRFALTGFTKTLWPQALIDNGPKFPDVLAFLDTYTVPVRFNPMEQDRAQYHRFRKLVEDARASEIEIEATEVQIVEAYLDLFRVFESKGLELRELTEWFHLSNEIRRLESSLFKKFLTNQVRRVGE